MSDAADYLESFSVMCPRCQCRFQPAVRVSTYFAKCPDCSEPVRVPAAAEVEDDWKREQAATEGETYRLSIPTDWDTPSEPDISKPAASSSAGQETPRPKKPESAAGKNQRSPQEPAGPRAVTVTCPGCGASFEPPVSDQPQVVLCPECLEDVPVPAASASPPAPPPEDEPGAEDEDSLRIPEPEPRSVQRDPIPWHSYLEDEPEPAAKPKKKRRKPKQTAAEAESTKNPTRREAPKKHIDDVMAEIRRVEEDPPPEWTFFSGVTDFLIRPSVAVRWVFASIGFCLMGWLCAIIAHFYGNFTIAIAFFALPLIWITVMTLSYTGANCMAILLETASGNDQVEGWPEPVMKEQAVDLVYLAFILIVAEVLSFFLGQIVGLIFGPPWLVMMVLGFLIYPIVLLSSLEANSPYVPLTLPILKSLKTVTWAWGVFYGLTGGLLLAWVLPLVWVFGRSGSTQFVGVIVLAPLAAGWCYLYARLLGRLAWRASLEFEEEDEEGDDGEPKKPKKKKPGSENRNVSESSGELQATQ